MINVAVDVETTGLEFGTHEIVQIAVVILDKDFNVTSERFFSNIQPNRAEFADPTAMKVNGLDLKYLEKHAPVVYEVLSSFRVWRYELFDDAIFYPLFHNGVFDVPFLKLLFPMGRYEQIFHYHTRDTFSVARTMKDCGLIDPESCSLGKLAEYFGIVNDKPHHALEDAKTTAAVYRKLLEVLKK